MAPTYDYSCASCKHKFERLEKMNAKGLKKCPKCNKKKAKRLLGPGNFILKGDGFYNTTYRKKT